MRPRLDIPHQLHGRVRDLADERDEHYRETYEAIIRHGLDALGDDE